MIAHLPFLNTSMEDTVTFGLHAYIDYIWHLVRHSVHQGALLACLSFSIVPLYCWKKELPDQTLSCRDNGYQTI